MLCLDLNQVSFGRVGALRNGHVLRGRPPADDWLWLYLSICGALVAQIRASDLPIRPDCLRNV